ncbi:unnamed protein product, partial [Mesorhabditis belari]|uniref:HMG box domain-containing protein n=1 Tax=Mesorhabditis belari TaxID=2138241 RepID=A0AAF3EYV1_9BILA
MGRPRKDDGEPATIKKVKKDPNMPKRGQSAFFHWLNENRERIKKENPGVSVGQIGKIAGVDWGKITDKSKWEKLAAEDRKRYEKEMAAYKAK